MIAVLRERQGRGGSISLHDDVKAGDRLQVRSPRNDFPLAISAIHSILLAGGIGITPLLSMIDTLWRRGSSFELHYSTRDAGRAAFAAAIKAVPYAGRIHFHWSGDAGRLNMTNTLKRAPSLSHVYACGPQAFISGAVSAHINSGRPAELLHLERFSTAKEPRAVSV